MADEENPETAPAGTEPASGDAAPRDSSGEASEEGEQTGPPGAEAGLAFRQDDDGSLHADFTPSVSNVAVDGDALRRMLGEAGFGEVCLFREKVAELIRRQRDSKEPFSLAIGGHRDGAVEVTIDERGAAAEAQLRHPCGEGRAIDDAMIREALTAAGVTEGWMEEEFPRLIKDQGRTLTDPVVIARGRPPTDGEDTRFKSLVPDAPERKPRNLGDEIVDYREFGGVVTVAEGDPLVRRQPPTEGEPGRTVTGDPIQPRPGRNVDFKTDSTVRVAEDDPDTLVAAMGGMPVVTDTGAKVEQVVELDTVDLS
ncbi:MAG: flagellar assembly protein A, partial [Pseudomonadota bacterium]